MHVYLQRANTNSPMTNFKFILSFNRSSLFDNESLQTELWTTLYSLMEETFGAFLFTSEQSCRFNLKFKADDDSYSFYLYKKKKINFPYGGDLHKNYQTSQKILFFCWGKNYFRESKVFRRGTTQRTILFDLFAQKKCNSNYLLFHTLYSFKAHCDGGGGGMR